MREGNKKSIHCRQRQLRWTFTAGLNVDHILPSGQKRGRPKTFWPAAKNGGKMKSLVLFVFLASLSQTLSAQDIISTSNQSIQGTWIVQLTDQAGNLSLFEIGTFHPDGSYSGANTNASHTEHKGVWLRIGDRKFVETVMFFTRDDKGVFNGI